MVGNKAQGISEITWGIESIKESGKRFRTASKIILSILALMIVMGYLGSCKKAEDKEYGGAHSANEAIMVLHTPTDTGIAH